jgi:hypothetical protein
MLSRQTGSNEIVIHQQISMFHVEHCGCHSIDSAGIDKTAAAIAA